MRKLLVIAAAAATLTFPAMASASACKGLAEAPCGGMEGCQWRQAVTKGDTLKSGKTAARSIKAHCRAKPAPKAKKA